MGSFWWKDILRLNTLYRGIARCNIGDGASVLFWEDLWSAGILLSTSFPRLYSFVHNPQASVKEILQAENLEQTFSLPLSEQAYHELLELQSELQQLAYNPNSPD